MLTLDQLLNPPTEDEALAEILTTLSQLGFQTTSWQSGSVQLTLIRTYARLYVKLAEYIATNTSSGFVGLAKGEFLTLLARYAYGFERNEAAPTSGIIRLSSSAGAPVHSWNAGALIIANDEIGAANAVSFRAINAGSINPGTSVNVEVVAEIAGEIGNIAPSIPLFLWTPLVGVTASNPPVFPANTWVTVPGLNAESDERLSARCLGRWDRLSYGNTEGAYVAWALEALPELTRIAVKSAPGDGSVTIVGATALGGLTPAQITTISDYIYGINDGVGRRPINDIAIVVSATNVSTPSVSLQVFVQSQFRTGLEAKVTSALLSLFGRLPIGGEKLVSPTIGYVLISQIVDTVHNIEGVRSVNLLTPSTNVVLPETGIYTPTISVSVAEVL